jgi:1-acylglycerol-3-phosphate O-acyltransferase
MAIPGIWWVDLQLDGVKRGTLAEQPRGRVPHAGSVIAANFTSPIDAVYLAAIFDPVFTVSYPGVRGVQKIGLLGAIALALAPVRTGPPEGAKLLDLAEVLAEHPKSVVVVFPECGTTNGKAILPLSPSILTCPPDVHIFPVSLRYTAADVTTPVPGLWLRFIWRLLSAPTTCIRVRIAEGQTNTGATAHGTNGASDARLRGAGGGMSMEEGKVLDKISEALARLGRVKRVGLTMKDKEAFVIAWKAKKSR